jgi:hypothetical protein
LGGIVIEVIDGAVKVDEKDGMERGGEICTVRV